VVAELLRRASDTNNLRYLESNLVIMNIEDRSAVHLHLEVIRKDLDPDIENLDSAVLMIDNRNEGRT
jgi:hypothetical protein